MGLADAIAVERVDAAALSGRPIGCSMFRALEGLDEEDRQALRDYLADKRITAVRVVTFLNDQGQQMLDEARDTTNTERREQLEYVGHILSRVRSDTIRRHRRGSCSCPSEESA
jgi:hypothetical protein